MDRKGLDDIVERLKGYEAIVRAISKTEGISATMKDTLWCMADYLSFITWDFTADIGQAKDYLKEEPQRDG